MLKGPQSSPNLRRQLDGDVSVPTKRSRIGTSLGFSIVEVLVASAIIGVSILVLSTSIVEYGKATRKKNIVVAAISAESAIVEAFTDPTSYSEATRTSLTAGNIPPGFSIPMTTDAGPINIAFPFDGYFTERFGGCGADFTDPNCIIRIEAELRRLQPPTPTQAATYGMAYRIRLNPTIGIPLGNLGKPDNTPFVNTDFRTLIPHYLLLNDQVGFSGTCDPVLSAGMTGFNRDTGQAICLAKPTAADECPDNTIAKNLMGVPSGTTNRLGVRCVNVTSSGCPAGYAMSSFDTRSIDPAYGLGNNVCRIVTQESQAAGPFVGATVAGGGCPNRYAIQTSSYGCFGPFNVNSNQGTCRYSCFIFRTCPGSPLLQDDPRGPPPLYPQICAPGNVWTVDGCEGHFPAIPGNKVDTTSGNNINCRVVVPPQPCPAQCEGNPTTRCTAAATWSAQIRVNYTCIRDDTLTKPATP